MALPNINTNRTKKKTANVDISSMMYGKIPPQVRELEEAVLGAILLEKSAFDTVTEILKPECFYVEAHQMIFQSMQSLQQKNMELENQKNQLNSTLKDLTQAQAQQMLTRAFYAEAFDVLDDAHLRDTLLAYLPAHISPERAE